MIVERKVRMDRIIIGEWDATTVAEDILDQLTIDEAEVTVTTITAEFKVWRYVFEDSADKVLAAVIYQLV
jgi:hypothetical protein